jgi:hypothetical protein
MEGWIIIGQESNVDLTPLVSYSHMIAWPDPIVTVLCVCI